MSDLRVGDCIGDSGRPGMVGRVYEVGTLVRVRWNASDAVFPSPSRLLRLCVTCEEPLPEAHRRFCDEMCAVHGGEIPNAYDEYEL